MKTYFTNLMRPHVTSYAAGVFIVILGLILGSGSILAGGSGGGGGAKTWVATCKGDRALDRNIILAQIANARPGDTVLILGQPVDKNLNKVSATSNKLYERICQLDAAGLINDPSNPSKSTRLDITKGITVTGPICNFGDTACWTTIKGDKDPSNGNPLTVGTTGNQNRAFFIAPDTTATTPLVGPTVMNLRFEDTKRTIAVQSGGTFVNNSCLCNATTDGPAGSTQHNSFVVHTILAANNPSLVGHAADGTPYLLNASPVDCGTFVDITNFPVGLAVVNANITHNWMVHVFRGPQFFGAIQGSTMAGNKVENIGENDIVLQGGSAACYNGSEGNPDLTTTPDRGYYSQGDIQNATVIGNILLGAGYDTSIGEVLSAGTVSSAKILLNVIDGKPLAPNVSYKLAGIGLGAGYPAPNTFVSNVQIVGNIISNSAAALIIVGEADGVDTFGGFYDAGPPVTDIVPPYYIDYTNGVTIACNFYSHSQQQQIILSDLGPYPDGTFDVSIFGRSLGADVFLGYHTSNIKVQEAPGVKVDNASTLVNNIVPTHFNCLF